MELDGGAVTDTQLRVDEPGILAHAPRALSTRLSGPTHLPPETHLTKKALRTVLPYRLLSANHVQTSSLEPYQSAERLQAFRCRPAGKLDGGFS